MELIQVISNGESYLTEDDPGIGPINYIIGRAEFSYFVSFLKEKFNGNLRKTDISKFPYRITFLTLKEKEIWENVQNLFNNANACTLQRGIVKFLNFEENLRNNKSED